MKQLTLWNGESGCPTIPNPRIANKLRELADNLTPQINRLIDSSISNQRPTARRIKIAESMRSEGKQLQHVQAALLYLASLHESGKVPPLLENIRTRKAVEFFIRNSGYSPNKVISHYRDELASWGIETTSEFVEAVNILNSMKVPEDTTSNKIRQLENELVGRKIEEFFPTPPLVVERMLSIAQLKPGMRVLEPSAGNGAIAEAIASKIDGSPDVIEINSTLREILRLKNLNIVGSDFLEFQPTILYDAVLLNPPFSEEISHIQKAYQCRHKQGILVSVASTKVLFRSTTKYQAFKSWLNKVGAEIEELPDGSFTKSRIRTTEVATILITIKPQ
ncbi:class I SAM-dependent methyltransferase [Ancylothrix sp. C2]|uniref:class I SAM-dependent methyltransferase n=1 Tax=Ancylothrix sp. D3o TaxID=2953691 RepID=UPI0021BB9437|nr:class I SAM-dependent methyltransferase [Ancylothrix sp. D3o]MCT7953389.1 class I SAM-dependent methyltransferase [Ancylothrix sp. D3o]